MNSARTVALCSWLAVLSCVLPCSCGDEPGLWFRPEQLSHYSFGAYQGKQLLPDIREFLIDQALPQVEEVAMLSGAETLAGVLLSPGQDPGTGPVWLFLHGSSKHLDFYWWRVRLLAALGQPVLAVDYRGYGKSTGVPTMQGLIEDGGAALAFVVDRFPGRPVWIYGNSLGSVPATQVAVDQQAPAGPVVGLVLEAPIGSVRILEQQVGLPLWMRQADPPDNIARIRELHLPLLWLHGDRDSVLPIKTHGQPLFDAYREENPGAGQAVVVTGGDHEALVRTLGYALYLDLLLDFQDAK